MSNDWCVVGLTAAATGAGARHLDGAACAMTADRVVAVAEERLARRRHAGGAELALRAVLAELGREVGDVDGFFLSTCGEPPTGDPSARPLGEGLHASLADLGVAPERVHWVPSHHLSHALGAALLVDPDSGPGLVLVADDAGSSSAAKPEACERASAFLIPAGGAPPRALASIAAPDPGGLGSLYRVAAELAGFNGYTECGKATALAAYASAKPPAPRGRLLRGDQPLLVDGGARAALASHLGDGEGEEIAGFGGRRWHRGHAELLGEAQHALELELTAWLGDLLVGLGRRGSSCEQVVLCGGVALNCRLLGGLGEAGLGADVQAFHAPGDEGQALGNALWGALELGHEAPRRLARGRFLGPAPTAERVERAVAALAGGFKASMPSPAQLLDTLVATIAAGGLVAIYEGRSEYGPRALGHRSIVADPSSAAMRARLNTVKGREPFRPFGLVVRERHAASLTGSPLRSPAMLAALRLSPEAGRLVPAGVHVDGSSRLQTVAADEHSLLAELLDAWQRASGIPALINTSFNQGGEPLVETPEEAIEAARALDLDHLVLARPGASRPFWLLSR